MLHLHAALAERERKVISERTIAALAAASLPILSREWGPRLVRA
jgi:DNA invertase Pin-like site-specific DNA recombinase